MIYLIYLIYLMYLIGQTCALCYTLSLSYAVDEPALFAVLAAIL